MSFARHLSESLAAQYADHIKYLKVHTITAQLFVCFDEKTLVKSGDAP
jgi:hypothetical protein